MEVEEIVDKYRGSKSQVRFGLLVLIGLLPAINLWLNDGEALEDRKIAVEADYISERDKFESAKQKSAELPALLAKLTEIETELGKAKRILPDKIEMDSILGQLGALEKEVDVKLTKFTPNPEIMGEAGLEYKELPVDITIQGQFTNIMRFMDRIVHMQNLTHMRNIQFAAMEATEEEKKLTQAPPRKLESTARLVLFMGM
jgi:Tfp pilus assembly protein PilO